MSINFTGWVIADSEGVLLRIGGRMSSVPCDACDLPAMYDVCIPDADGGGISPMCQGCLEMSYEDPQSPDAWFAPVPKGTQPTVYSNGDQQLVINLSR
jgi:hypothetical protein